MEEKQRLTLKEWAEADRPREKLLARGVKTLSDAELLGILFGSGSRDESAVELGRKVLKAHQHNLHLLGKSGLGELTQFKGIGPAKAISLIAAIELGRRRQASKVLDKPKIRSSRDVFDLIAHRLADLPNEEFWMVVLNRANRVMGEYQISIGGTAGTVVDGKVLFRIALEAKASSLILAHNHPSGNLQPSRADINLTKKLKEGAVLLDLVILDHLIIADNGFYSFADEGLL
jgi:DNA repair protein RadC